MYRETEQVKSDEANKYSEKEIKQMNIIHSFVLCAGLIFHVPSITPGPAVAEVTNHHLPKSNARVSWGALAVGFGRSCQHTTLYTST